MSAVLVTLLEKKPCLLAMEACSSKNLSCSTVSSIHPLSSIANVTRFSMLDIA